MSIMTAACVSSAAAAFLSACVRFFVASASVLRISARSSSSVCWRCSAAADSAALSRRLASSLSQTIPDSRSMSRVASRSRSSSYRLMYRASSGASVAARLSSVMPRTSLAISEVEPSGMTWWSPLIVCFGLNCSLNATIDEITDCVNRSKLRTTSLNGRAASPLSIDAPVAVRNGSLGPFDMSPPVAGPMNVSVSANSRNRLVTLSSSSRWLSNFRSRIAATPASAPKPSRYHVLYACTLVRSWSIRMRSVLISRFGPQTTDALSSIMRLPAATAIALSRTMFGRPLPVSVDSSSSKMKWWYVLTFLSTSRRTHGFMSALMTSPSSSHTIASIWSLILSSGMSSPVAARSRAGMYPSHTRISYLRPSWSLTLFCTPIALTSASYVRRL